MTPDILFLQESVITYGDISIKRTYVPNNGSYDFWLITKDLRAIAAITPYIGQQILRLIGDERGKVVEASSGKKFGPGENCGTTLETHDDNVFVLRGVGDY